MENAPELLAEAPGAARQVGADAYVDVFVRAGAAGDDEDRLGSVEDDLYALEDADDLIWEHMLRYVEAHPDEFPGR